MVRSTACLVPLILAEVLVRGKQCKQPCYWPVSLTLCCSPGRDLTAAAAVVVLVVVGVVVGFGVVVKGSVVVLVGVGVVVASCIVGVGTGDVWSTLRPVSPAGKSTQSPYEVLCDTHRNIISNTPSLRQPSHWCFPQGVYKHPHLWTSCHACLCDAV